MTDNGWRICGPGPRRGFILLNTGRTVKRSNEIAEDLPIGILGIGRGFSGITGCDCGYSGNSAMPGP